MNIRKANLSDVEVIASQNILLAKESEEISLSIDTVLPGVIAVLSDKSKGFYVLAEENKKIIGQVMITYEWSDWRNTNIWWIQSVYVQKKWRTKGIFSKLFQYILKQAQTNQVKIIRLYVHENNKAAQKIYQKIGMKTQPYVFFQHNIIKINSQNKDNNLMDNDGF
jgi:ribosomal protein S18 acetylase RimI-like enzyme